MTLLDEIRENFSTKFEGARVLKQLPKIYPAETIRLNGEYGVAVPFTNEQPISETFANVKIQSKTMNIGGNLKDVLFLSCDSENLKYEFASLCAEFAEPGMDGKKRKELIKNPVSWWEKWTFLLGNSISDKNVYSVIGELYVLEYLIKNHQPVVWLGPNAGSHDIESENHSYEVKSTVMKSKTTITISSQHQLSSEKPLSLMFCRLEASEQGDSVNSMVKRLVAYGLKMSDLESKLDKLGLEKGRTARMVRYRMLEGREYKVDEEFPKITKESFVDQKLPDHMEHIEYTIDLEGLEYTTWE